jgi:hypothetical protein
MNEDTILFIAVFAVWAMLALVYATVPLLSMPAYATVWGWGSIVFLVLAAITARRA